MDSLHHGGKHGARRALDQAGTRVVGTAARRKSPRSLPLCLGA